MSRSNCLGCATGPLDNPAERDHCIQYMLAVPSPLVRLTAPDYEDAVAVDPRIGALRAKMVCVDDPKYTRAYHDPDKRSIASSVALKLTDGTQMEEVAEYPIGQAALPPRHPPAGGQVSDQSRTTLRAQAAATHSRRVAQSSAAGGDAGARGCRSLRRLRNKP